MGKAEAEPLSSSSSSSSNLEGVLKDASSYWSTIVLRGALLLSLGLVFVVLPETTVSVIGILFGVMVLFEAGWSAIQLYAIQKYSAPNPMRGAIMTFFCCTVIVNLILGILAIVFPNETARVLLLIVAIWFVVVGVLELLLVCLLKASGDLRHHNGNNAASCSMVLAGVLFLVFGIVLLSDLDQGVETFTRLIGAVIMLFAMQVICFGLFVRALRFDNGQDATKWNGDNDKTEKSTVSAIV